MERRTYEIHEDTPIYTIGVVARMLKVHPQTLRFYERQGLIRPHRTTRNVRLYSPKDVERLRVIVTLIQDLGVNVAGAEIILEMRERILQLQKDLARVVARLREENVDIPELESLQNWKEAMAIIPMRRTPVAPARNPKGGSADADL